MFLMAGRMVGHSFIHGSPCLSGISPPVMHVLLGQPPETATIQLQDCLDLDHRATIQLLEEDAELSDQDKKAILDLALSWDPPGVTNNNRHWLFNRLLHHAVLRRTIRQIKQKFGHCCKNVQMFSLCSSPETPKLPAVLRLFWMISYGLRRKRMTMMIHTYFKSNVTLRSTSVVLLRAVLHII